MSILTYNGIVLPYNFTTSFRQEAVRDDMGDTDWIYTKYDITSQGVLTANYLNVISADISNQGGNVRSPADIQAYIRSKLLAHRKSLSLKFNNAELIPQETGGAGTVDVANGPKPLYCDIQNLTNQSFLLTFRITAAYWENMTPGQIPPQNNSGNTVLFNRWTETVDIDNANYSRRTREGKYQIRSDNVQSVIADQIRSSFAIVGVPEGFLRDSSTYTTTADGLAVQYRVVDREVFKLPPIPAFEADGEYVETAVRGAKRYGEVWVRLKADKTTNQAVLLQTCLGVALAKLRTNPNAGAVFNFLESAAVKVKLYENEVEVRARSYMKPQTTPDGTGRIAGAWGFDTQNMTITPGSEQGQTTQPPYKDRGTASMLLQAAAYWDPSLASTLFNPTIGQNVPGLAPGTAGATLETTGSASQSSPFFTNQLTATELVPEAIVNVGTLVPSDAEADFIDLSPPLSFFVDYMINSRFESDKHIYMMPLASPTPFNGASVAFCQLASPTLIWVVDWTASKLLEQPEIPDSTDPVVLNDGWVLLDEHYEPVMVTKGSDGETPLYRISGTYVYGNTNPATITIEDLTFPRPPYLQDEDDRSMPVSTLFSNLI